MGSSPRMVRIELEVVPDRDPPEGRLRSDGGEETSFIGWLELMTALDRIRGTASSAGEPSRAGESRPR